MAVDDSQSVHDVSVHYSSRISIRVPSSPITQSVWKEKHNQEADDVATRLTWKDLSVRLTTAKGRSHAILHGVSGYAEPGSITAIMGPSGCGKSTLLDTFAGRLARNANLSGEIRVNGHKKQLSYGMAAYVAQDDVLLGTLTVRETITFSANLRLPDHMPVVEKQAVIETAIAEMGLRDCADTAIGNWHLRGLSGGEKRRVSIAVEILTRPRLLFLDEPTSGLDSASAFFVICTLRNLARDGRTVLASIHQPSSEVFRLFDKLVLLSHGRTIYFGDASRAKEFFAFAGFPCPKLRNPSDHFLRVVNSDFDTVRANLKSLSHQKDFESFSDILDSVSARKAIQILTDTFRTSEIAATVAGRIEEMNSTKGLLLDSHGSRASFLMQTFVLTRRSTANMFRDLGYYWLRLAIYLVVTICVGSIFFRVGTTFDAINARASCMSFLTGFLCFMSVGGFPSFVEDMKVFVRERLNGHYGVMAYVVANSLSSIPFLFLISIACASIGYPMISLHPGVGKFTYFVLSLFASLLTVEGLMMAVATIVPNFLMGIVTGAGILGVFLLLAGFFRLPNEIPKPVWRYPVSFMGYNLYSFQGCLENDFIGLEFDNSIPGGPKLPGATVLQKTFHIDTTRSKWVNLAIIFALAILYRLIFSIMVKLSEKMGPLIRATLSKYTFPIADHSRNATEGLECAPRPNISPDAEMESFNYPLAVDQDHRTFMKVLETLS